MKRIIILLILVLTSCQNEKVKNTFFNECFSIDKASLINNMVYSFESKICDYYGFQIEDSDKAFKKYVEDSSNNDNNIDLRKLTSRNELNLLDKSNKDLKEDVWITFKEKIESEDLDVEDEIEIVTIEGTIDEEYENKYKNLLTVNYYGKFAECLIKNSESEDFKQMVLALKRVGDISPILVANGLTEFDTASFNEYSMKSFIAFELYYATLNMISKN